MMNQLNAVRELFRHHDWAVVRLLGPAGALSDAELDRPFEMGPGSLRKTLWHNAGAHWIWFRRIAGESPTSFFATNAPQTVSAFRAFWTTARQERDALFDSVSDPNLKRPIDYRDLQGNSYTSPLRDIVVQVANHAQHHHAQANNMLRQLGVKPARLDYLHMHYLAQPSEAPRLSVEMLRDYYGYSDWARWRISDLVNSLDDAKLDRTFEMGTGSIRKNMCHACDAECWWWQHWTGGERVPFPQPDGHPRVGDICARFDDVASKRNAMLEALTDDDLLRPIDVKPALDRTVSFPLGVSMLQLCNHGTHHRAQTINMLRQVGIAAPRTDYIIYKWDLAAAGATS